MKEIFQLLEKEINKHRDLFKKLTNTNKFKLYNELNRIISNVGRNKDILLQINFLSNKELNDIDKFGKRNLTIIKKSAFESIASGKNKRKFMNLTIKKLEDKTTKIIDKSEIKNVFKYNGKEGYRIVLQSGRIEILPGVILVWCDITDKIIELIDWIFKFEYSN